MNIAIDIDDTLTDSFDYFLPFVAEYFSADADDLRARRISYSNLPAAWKDQEIAFARSCYDRLAAQTPFKPDAARSVAQLRAQGHRIIIITGRTDEFYTDPYRTTREELANGEMVYDKLICTMDKAGACRAEAIDVLIDDLPANCRHAAECGIPALLFLSRANQGEPTEQLRVENWTEALAAVAQIERGYPNRTNAQQLLAAAEQINPGPWANHCRVAARCAEAIARSCGLDAEKAYVLGLLHDIGRRFRVRDLGHIYYGYQYMRRLGYAQVARVCLSHSFPNRDLQLYIGQIDIPAGEAETVKNLLATMQWDAYDELIQLCDALAGSEGVVDIEERMADVRRRYGRYPQAQWDKNVELQRAFEKKAGRSIADMVGGAAAFGVYS